MVEPSGDSASADLERVLRALAADDRRVRVPDHVHAAVVNAWDARAPRVRWTHGGRRSRWLWPFGAIAATAAALLAAVSLHDYGRRETSTSAPRTARIEPAVAQQQGLVLVADPVLDASALTVVRVRVPRSTLAHLGVTLADPDATGSIDLEVLVGEDGTARTIRRVVPVATAAVQE
jgi:hypothetical protein